MTCFLQVKTCLATNQTTTDHDNFFARLTGSIVYRHCLMCMFNTVNWRACRNRTGCKDYRIRCKFFDEFWCHFCIHKDFHVMTFYLTNHHIFEITKIRFVDIYVCEIQKSAKFV